MADYRDETGPLLTPAEAEEIRDSHFLFDLPNAVFSSLFLCELRRLRDGRILDTHEIADEIRALEGREAAPGTKPATQFERPPLKDFWHKHFFNPCFMQKNLALHWKVAPGKGKMLEEMLEREFVAEKSGRFADELIKKVAANVIDGGFRDRAADARLTGEWIVFAKHTGKHFYLTVASHSEGDDVIYDRIVTWCKPEYPFLFGD